MYVLLRREFCLCLVVHVYTRAEKNANKTEPHNHAYIRYAAIIKLGLQETSTFNFPKLELGMLIVWKE